MSNDPTLLRGALELVRVYESRLDALARKHGQSRARFQILTAARSGKTVPDIGRTLGRTRQSVQRIVDALAESGLVRFEPNPAHQRSPLVELTDSGVRITDRIEQQVAGWDSAVAATLDAEETEAFLLALAALRDGLER
jgi:DNA-binding MarR family transcriptional regulator